jgi:hypothetical protein
MSENAPDQNHVEWMTERITHGELVIAEGMEDDLATHQLRP